MRKTLSTLIILFTIGSMVYGSHIVGGRIYYECLGNQTYKIILKIYRDCYNGEAPFDQPASVSIYNRADNSLYDVLKMSGLKVKRVPVIINDPCLSAPPNVCVEEGIYEAVIKLPSNVAGYLLAYQRCCRNKTIANLVNPNEQGATYYTIIPSVGVGGLACNNSPVFKEWPPIAICADKKFEYDYSATDPDGDSLAYKFCAPLKGASIDDPIPDVAKAPPYNEVTFNTSRGFSAQYPVSASPPLKIDVETGIITGKPTVEGQYVVGVCVEEYRNGKLIGTEIRDFQFNVTACRKKVDALISVPYPDTSINNCQDYKIDFTNLSDGTNEFLWDFGVTGRSDDVSTKKNPSYTYPDTGTYRVRLIAGPSGFCADTDYVTVKIYPLLDAEFSVANTCPQDSVPLTDLSNNTYGAIEKWKWDFGDGNNSKEQNPVYRYKSGGIYEITLEVTNKYGCRDEVSQPVKIFPKPHSKFHISEHCLYKPMKLEYLSTIDSGKIVSHEWDLGADPPVTDTTTSPSYTFQRPGNYLVRLVEVSDQGCVDTFEQEIKVRPITEAKVTSDTAICATSPLQLNASGGLYYKWEPSGAFQQNISNPYVRPAESTTYTVYVSDGCYDDSAVVNIETKTLPYLRISADTSILKGGAAVLAASSNAKKFKWSPSEFVDFPFSSKTKAYPSKTTTYTVQVTGKNGCKKEGEVRVEVLPDCYKVFLPNAFTPNGDGVNDYFYPKNSGDALLKEFRVYNRWGRLVFKSENPDQGWNGTIDGEPLEIGSYAYTVIMHCSGEDFSINGNVLLLR